MVHALKEIWRVLVPGGSLIDLRPLSGNTPVEVVAGGQVLLAGLLDETRYIPDDAAANESLAQVVREGWFVRESTEAFDCSWYWDTLDEMKAYLEEDPNWGEVLPQDVVARAGRLMASGGEDARVRIRFNMVIARYRKESR